MKCTSQHLQLCTHARLTRCPCLIADTYFDSGMSHQYEMSTGKHFNVGPWLHGTGKPFFAWWTRGRNDSQRALWKLEYAWTASICGSCRREIIMKRNLIRNSITLDASIGHCCKLLDRCIWRAIFSISITDWYKTVQRVTLVYETSPASASKVQEYHVDLIPHHYRSVQCRFSSVCIELLQTNKWSRERGVPFIPEHSSHAR